ncbi:MAG: DUF927 domain-containing protein [Holosporales bacterium]|jgi:hypothetical protein|nr:DUF927 domain-containing protein [Holosporales bacterium]
MTEVDEGKYPSHINQVIRNQLELDNIDYTDNTFEDIKEKLFGPGKAYLTKWGNTYNDKYFYDNSGALLVGKETACPTYLKCTHNVIDKKGLRLLQIEFIDILGNFKYLNVQCSLLVKKKTKTDVAEYLASHGVSPTADFRLIQEYLIDATPPGLIKTLLSTGWHKDGDNQVFITPAYSISSLPKGSLSPDANTIYRLEDTTETYGYALSGTADEYSDHVIKYIEGNPIPEFVTFYSMSGLFKKDQLKNQSYTISLVGPSGTGKTTSLEIAASAWGNPEDFRQFWNSTGLALQQMIAHHNNSILILDENALIDAKEFKNLAYSLFTGKGKVRCKRDGTLDEQVSWTANILSSSEKTLEEKLAEIKLSPMERQNARFIDLHVNRGGEDLIFPNLHGFKSHEDFIKRIENNISKYHGSISKHAITILLEKYGDKLEQVFRDKCEQVSEKFYKIFNLNDECSTLRRQAIPFIETNACAEILIEEGVVKLNCESVSKNIFKLFDNIVKCRKEQDEFPEATTSEKLHAALSTNAHLIVQLTDRTFTLSNRRTIAFRGEAKIGDTVDTYHIIRDYLEKEFLPGQSYKKTLRDLAAEGTLKVAKRGPDLRFTDRVTLNGVEGSYYTANFKKSKD